MCVYVYYWPVAAAVVVAAVVVAAVVAVGLRLRLWFVSGFGATAATPRSHIATAVWVMVAVAGATLQLLDLALARTNVLIHERVLIGRERATTEGTGRRQVAGGM